MGFPSRELPKKPPVNINLEEWDKLINDLTATNKLNQGWLPHVRQVRKWMAEGCEAYVEHPGTIPTKGTHHITGPEVQLALETVCKFVESGHIAGPFDKDNIPYELQNLKYIGLFGKMRPHGGSLRLINDHSSPPGRSFNDGISDDVINNIHLHMSNISDIITSLILAGCALMSKFDLAEAYQNLSVALSQYPLQAIELFGALFFCLKLTYGDKQACHRFSRFHEILIRTMILPQSTLGSLQCEMVVDDVTAIANIHEEDKLRNFGNKYRSTLEKLGLQAKPNDPLGFKAFECKNTGEILGIMIDSQNLQWSLSKEKNAKIIESLDLVYNCRNLKESKKITLKAAQRVTGKLTALTTACNTLNTWLVFPRRDVADFIKANPKENRKSEGQQSTTMEFSHQARRDLNFFRAMLTGIHEHWIPIRDPDQTEPDLADLVVYTDASGKVDLEEDEPGPALGVVIPAQNNTIARAVSWPLPMEFLEAEDDIGANHHNTILLEALAILATIIRFPATFQNTKVIFYTDSLSFAAVYKSRNPRGRYVAHTTKCILQAAAALRCDLHVKWKRRRSCAFTRAADTLTHQDFQETPENIQYRRVEKLPEPILKTLCESVTFPSNKFNKMFNKIVKYWKSNSN